MSSARRCVLCLTALAAIVGSAASVSAGVPSPAVVTGCGEGGVGVPWVNRSGVGFLGAGAPCQFRFRADGGLDQLAIEITVRDLFDTPIPNIVVDTWSTSSIWGCWPAGWTRAARRRL
jgi:hypothetical protein